MRAFQRNRIENASTGLNLDVGSDSNKVIFVGNSIPEDSAEKTNLKYFLLKHVVDVKDELYYRWLGIVSCAFAYNLVVVIGKVLWIVVTSIG